MKTKLVPKYQKGNRISGYVLPEVIVTPSKTQQESIARKQTSQAINKFNEEMMKILGLVKYANPATFTTSEVLEYALNSDKQNTGDVNPELATAIALASRNPVTFNPYTALLGLAMGAMLAKKPEKPKTKPSITLSAESPANTENTTTENTALENTTTENTTSSQPSPEPENDKDKKKREKEEALKQKREKEKALKQKRKEIFNNAKETVGDKISQLGGYATGVIKSPLVLGAGALATALNLPEIIGGVVDYGRNYGKRMEKAVSPAPADTIPFTKTENIQWQNLK